MTIYVGGGAAMLVCLALMLAVPDMSAVISGKDTDPVATTLRTAMGEVGFRAVLAVVLVSFISCALSMQAAASRLLFAYARDEMIVGSELLSRISPHTHVPVAALLVAGLIPAADRAVRPVAAERRRDHHQLRLCRNLYGLSDARARRADRAREGLAARRPLSRWAAGAGR